MRRILFSFLAVLLFSFSSNAQQLKSPSEFLGYELGATFTRHHQVVDYFRYVANTLDNVKLEEYGTTNEGRLLQVAYVSSQNNIDNLENIRQNNLKQIGIQAGGGTNDIAIVWLSYNVHGNESSSTEASMKTIYELVTKKQAWLENTVVIIDPCINPDGRDRYVNWFKQVRSIPYNKEQSAKEHNEPWPGGRPNHYLFDLNRDWAWATQVESQQRLKVYNKWMPHVHVDFHEQGINEPYYFAPAAEPFHEIISDWQRNFQIQIGRNNAKYFDKEGWLYFTKERFDLLYPSYGDTYPTFMGGIGMTYEQAGHGRAGLGIVNDEGDELTLKDRIIHHTTTGLSTIEISSENAIKLNIEFRNYFNNSTLKYKSYILRGEKDKLSSLKTLLDRHEIKYGMANSTSIKGYDYQSNRSGSIKTNGNDLVVSTDQPKGKMVKVLFEPETKLTDSLTYDITAWSLPYAYGLQSFASTSLVGTSPSNNSKVNKLNSVDKSAYAYLAKWNHVKDAEFLGQLLQNNIRVRFSETPFSIGGKNFERGTLIIVRGDNKKLDDFDASIVQIANKVQRELTSVKTGFVDKGSDFGSPNVKRVGKQHIALISGKGTSSLSFGATLHFFETQLKYPVTILDTGYFGRTDYDDFDVIILPEGSYDGTLNDSTMKKLKEWVRSGGKLIVIGRGLENFASKEGFSLKEYESEKEDQEDKEKEANLNSYETQEREYIKKLITGSIYKAKVDNTHPLGYGYPTSYYTLKLSDNAYQLLNNGGNVVYLSKNAQQVSGFVGSNAAKKQGNSLVFGQEHMGSGSIIYFVDNPLFRGFWENGKLFVCNAVFLTNKR